MAGVKGRSGRRTIAEEIQRADIIKKAWNMIGTSLDNKEIPLVTRDVSRVGIASKIVASDMAKHVEGEVKLESHLHLNNIQLEDFNKLDRASKINKILNRT